MTLFSAGTLTPAITGGVSAPGSMWHLLILNVFSFVADYGWRIVVFTVLLKLVLSPLDFYQRYKMHKNQKITERLKPTMEKIQKQYGHDKRVFSQKQMELNRKEGYSYFSSCLPMIVSLVVFITLWNSMRTISSYMQFKEYTTLYDQYQYVYNQIYTPPPLPDNYDELSEEEKKAADEEHLKLVAEYDKTTPAAVVEKIGADVVYRLYYYGLDEGYTDELKTHTYSITTGEGDEAVTTEYKFSDYIPSDLKLLREGQSSVGRVQAKFLWIENIWAADVPWGEKAILDWTTFSSNIGDYKEVETSGLSTKAQSDCYNPAMYNRVMYKLLNDTTHSHTNGLLLLPVLVVLLSLASQLLSMFQQKRAGQTNAKGGMATSMKVMMVIMPIMLAIFALQYASIFSLYMVVNSASTLFFNLLFTSVIKLMDKRKTSRNYGISSGSTRRRESAASPIIHFTKGANPHAGEKIAPAAPQPADSAEGGKKNKKSKKQENVVRPVQRGGRPDPNDLMGMDMSSKNNKKK